MQNAKKAGALFLMALILAGCAAPASRTAQASGGARSSDAAEDAAPSAPQEALVCGEASWYGAELAGRPTANGETFDPSGLTAAHRALPFDTIIRVEYEGRVVDVRINDRGPFYGDRILDLSRAAAERLGFVSEGAADVCYTIVAAG